MISSVSTEGMARLARVSRFPASLTCTQLSAHEYYMLADCHLATDSIFYVHQLSISSMHPHASLSEISSEL